MGLESGPHEGPEFRSLVFEAQRVARCDIGAPDRAGELSFATRRAEQLAFGLAMPARCSCWRQLAAVPLLSRLVPMFVFTKSEALLVEGELHSVQGGHGCVKPCQAGISERTSMPRELNGAWHVGNRPKLHPKSPVAQTTGFLRYTYDPSRDSPPSCTF